MKVRLFLSAIPRLALQFSPTILVLAVTSGFVILILATHEWSPMAFVRLGTRFTEGDSNGTIGYDGQFAYQIALNPLEAVPYLDIPAYRYQRILYPMMARIVGLGQPPLIPWALIGVNILALTVGTRVISILLAEKNLSRWYAVTLGVFAGQLVSLRLNLNEPLSITFALLGIHAFEDERPRLGAVYLSLSMLSKETAIAFVGGYLLYFSLKSRWRTFVETALISLGPFAVWQVVLWYAFGQIGLRSGGEGATSFSLIPFGGMFAFGLQDAGTSLAIFLILGPLALLPSLALTVVLTRAFLRWDFSPVAIILALHVIIMATLPFSTYVDLPGMLRLTSGLVVSTVAFGAVTRSLRLLNYSVLWVASLALLKFVV
jgi:hypothetical protein